MMGGDDANLQQIWEKVIRGPVALGLATIDNWCHD